MADRDVFMGPLEPIRKAPRNRTRVVLVRFEKVPDTGDLEIGTVEWRDAVLDPNTPQKTQCAWVSTGFWDIRSNLWRSNDFDEMIKPTHWCPLPEPMEADHD